jgi:hypothetical protein
MAAMATAAGPTVSGRPFTRADLADMPADGRRCEIIDGVPLVSAAQYREVANVSGGEAYAAAMPYRVVVVPAELVR